jgi:hypothetical protein
LLLRTDRGSEYNRQGIPRAGHRGAKAGAKLVVQQNARVVTDNRGYPEQATKSPLKQVPAAVTCGLKRKLKFHQA